jgi:hypothetical protein
MKANASIAGNENVVRALTTIISFHEARESSILKLIDVD